MPSSFTQILNDREDVTVAEYAGRVAVGFMFGGDIDAKPVFPKPAEQSAEFESAKRELDEWNALTEEERYAKWSDYFIHGKAKLSDQLIKNQMLIERYNSMLEKLTEVYLSKYSVDIGENNNVYEFHNYMVRQIERSLEHDTMSFDEVVKWFAPTEYVKWCENTQSSLSHYYNFYKEYSDSRKVGSAERVEFAKKIREIYGVKFSD